MIRKRGLGELEAKILAVLWSDDRPMTPAEVLGALDSDLAYTTVMTVLGRLWTKGLAHRVKVGRAFAYSAAISEADLSADRMRSALESSSNVLATMSQFVEGLDRSQQDQLRSLLEDRDR